MSKQPPESTIAKTSSLAGELRVVIGKLHRRLRQEAQLGDFTLSQVHVLIRLEREGPATVTTLAKAEGVRPQSMGATIAVLQAAGLITGAPDPADGRQTILSLTPECLQKIRATRAAKEDWLFRTLQTKLSLAEQAELAASLVLLRRLLDLQEEAK